MAASSIYLTVFFGLIMHRSRDDLKGRLLYSFFESVDVEEQVVRIIRQFLTTQAKYIISFLVVSSLVIFTSDWELMELMRGKLTEQEYIDNSLALRLWTTNNLTYHELIFTCIVLYISCLSCYQSFENFALSKTDGTYLVSKSKLLTIKLDSVFWFLAAFVVFLYFVEGFQIGIGSNRGLMVFIFVLSYLYVASIIHIGSLLYSDNQDKISWHYGEFFRSIKIFTVTFNISLIACIFAACVYAIDHFFS